MDYETFLQRHVTKIAIGLTIVGATTFTIWYYNSDGTEQLQYIDEHPIQSQPKRIEIQSNGIEYIKQKHFDDDNNIITDISKSSASCNQNTNIQETKQNTKQETDKSNNESMNDELNMDTSQGLDLVVEQTQNDKDQKNDKRNNIQQQNKNDNKEIELLNENEIGNDMEIQQNKKLNDDMDEPVDDRMNVETENEHIEKVSALKSKYDIKIKSKESEKITTKDVNESDEKEKVSLEIHARNEKVSKKHRKIGKLNKNRNRFMRKKQNNYLVGINQTVIPRKEIQNDGSWVKHKNKRSSTGHDQHPSVMQLNLNKLVTEAINEEKDKKEKDSTTTNKRVSAHDTHPSVMQLNLNKLVTDAQILEAIKSKNATSRK